MIDDLKAKYPLLYRNLGWIECGEGWGPLLHRLSAVLEAEIAKLPPEEAEECYAVQCKEKFGTLRFYAYGTTPSMDIAIAAAEEASGTICEVCGEPGILMGPGWFSTLCDPHRLKSK